MANTLPNKITKAQATATADASFNQYNELKGIYAAIAEQAKAGAYSLVTTVTDPDINAFVKAELLEDGYTVSGEGTEITINWGQAPI